MDRVLVCCGGCGEAAEGAVEGGEGIGGLASVQR